MNIIDFILGAIFLFSSIGGLIITVSCIKDDELEAAISIGFLALVGAFITGFSFLVLDKGSGSTIGEITSIDKNFFGTTALYIKTSETTQEEYCIESEEVVEQAKELIGKKVKVSYGERVGIYSTGRCNQAPIEKIEVIEGGSEK